MKDFICEQTYRKVRIYSDLRKQPSEVFCKKGVLRNFTKFTGKHCARVSFNKVADLRPATL